MDGLQLFQIEIAELLDSSTPRLLDPSRPLDPSAARAPPTLRTRIETARYVSRRIRAKSTSIKGYPVNYTYTGVTYRWHPHHSYNLTTTCVV